MKGWMDVVRVAVVVGLMCPSPMAWAQLSEVDPALHAAVEALVTADPEVAGDPELAQLCRTVAEATVTDIRERVAVTTEVAVMQREGVDIATVIPREVRESAREQFTKMQGEMQKELETLRAVDPEKAKEIEFMMREGEQCMLAFESGEHYTPSTEMVTHAEGMFKDWESGMLAQGAPPEFVDRARMEFTAWSGGEFVGFGGAGHEMMGGPGHMPSVEQMQTMGMTAEQIQQAQTYAGAYTGGDMMMGGQGTYAGPMTEHMTMGPMPSWEGHAMGGGMMGGTTWEAAAVGGTTWEAAAVGGTTATQYESSVTSTELKQDLQASIVDHARISTHTLAADGHAEEHWDGNTDGIADHTHPIGTGAHH